MKHLFIAMAVSASPAYAHHEVIVATSIMPAMLGALLVVTAGLAAFRRKLTRKAAKRTD